MSCQDSTMGPETKLAATAPKAENNQASATPPQHSFITLPPEISNMIYEGVVVAEEPICPTYGRLAAPNRVLGIGRASKQTQRVALPMYLGLNTFCFNSYLSIERMGDFLGALSKRERDLVRNIRFDFCGRSRLRGLQLLADCANLHKLEIEASEETILSSKWKKGDDFDLCASNGMRALFKIRGCKEVVVNYSERYADREDVPKPSPENIKRFVDRVKRELCLPRGEKKKRKSREQGKKGKKKLAAA